MERIKKNIVQKNNENGVQTLKSDTGNEDNLYDLYVVCLYYDRYKYLKNKGKSFCIFVKELKLKNETLNNNNITDKIHRCIKRFFISSKTKY